MLYNLHVRLWPVAFAELPHVDNISVEDYFFGLNGFEVAEKFLRMAPERAQVNVRNDYNINLPFFSFTHAMLKVIPKARKYLRDT